MRKRVLRKIRIELIVPLVHPVRLESCIILQNEMQLILGLRNVLPQLHVTEIASHHSWVALKCVGDEEIVQFLRILQLGSVNGGKSMKVNVLSESGALNELGKAVGTTVEIYHVDSCNVNWSEFMSLIHDLIRHAAYMRDWQHNGSDLRHPSVDCSWHCIADALCLL